MSQSPTIVKLSNLCLIIKFLLEIKVYVGLSLRRNAPPLNTVRTRRDPTHWFVVVTWHCADHGARRHGQKGHLPSSPWKCYKMFCTLVVTVKRLVDQLFMHHFYNFSSAPRPLRGSTPGLRWGTFVSRPPNLPTPGKNPAGTHGADKACCENWQRSDADVVGVAEPLWRKSRCLQETGEQGLVCGTVCR